MVKDTAELNEALAAFNILQSENYDGAAHDLAPAQERIRRALSGFQPERGLVRLAVECAPGGTSWITAKITGRAGRNAPRWPRP